MPSKERGGVSIIVGDGRQRIDAVGDRRTVDHRSGVQCTAHGAALVLSSLCDDHHEKALFSTELRKKNRAFLTAPGLVGISSELMQSHWTKRFEERHLGGYAADVFEMEDRVRGDRPRSVSPRLLTLRDRTLFTPHLGSAVRSARLAIEQAAADAIAAVLCGSPPANAVNSPAPIRGQPIHAHAGK
jgi:hypothetical protein